MPLEDYLLPGEEIRFHSNRNVMYSGKQYELLVTNKRLLLYAKRGLLLKRGNVVSVKLEEMRALYR